ncbi:DUF4468 domain-containing protein [Chryseobacterium sp. ISL-6]|uniref:DUF4468 domain-containing protein n=1 Tax=Chryseobacterium sp. ISL-6 TaxID=2819143 RepID=UPI001BE8CB32|nr:DUF4468 domain-containing protein [Chryseobacterium sp. ISL-6]MBT2620360.1 DUF4468 domain-containing protein [Chryseobacterium sp. ISL-6]
MKKITLLLLLMFANFSFGQKITVTPTGLKDSGNIEKSFVIIHAEGKTAKQLYDESLKYINKNYKSADDVIKGKTDGEYLKFVTFAPSFITIKNGFAKAPFTAKYTTELSFKDNKVKYEIIELEMYNEANYKLNFTGSEISFFIFNKKGELKKEDAKNSIEEYFNANILSLSNFLQGKTVEDKW